MLWRQTRSELLRFWRVPLFSVSCLTLPIMLFLFFGLPHRDQVVAGINGGRYFLAVYATYATTLVMMFCFGIGIATERGQKMAVLMRTTPLRPAVYFGAKVLTAMAFALLTLLVLFAFAMAVGVRLPAAAWLTLTWELLLGALPFLAMGFALGQLTGPNSAPAVINVIYMPMAFCSGMFIPVSDLPEFVHRVAPYLPTYRYSQLSWSAVGLKTDSLLVIFGWLAAYAVVFFVIAVHAYRSERGARLA
jgi:ABC-2 type transport system permease protein